MVYAGRSSSTASGETAERKKDNHYKKLFHVPVGGMFPIIMETGGRLTEYTRRVLSSYIRRDIMGVEDEDKWTPHPAPSCQVVILSRPVGPGLA